MRHLFIFCLLLGIATALPAQQSSDSDCNFTTGSSEDIPKIATQHYGPKADLSNVIPVETSSVKVAYPKGHPKRTNQFPDDYDYLQNKIDALPESNSTLYFVAGKYRIKKSLLLKSNMKIEGQQGAVLSGAMVLKDWKKEGNVYTHSVPIGRQVYDNFKCQEKNDICKNSRDLFWNGQWLKELEELDSVKKTSSTWIMEKGSNSNRVVVHLPETASNISDAQMELSATKRAFSNEEDSIDNEVNNRRTTALKNITVKNLTFEMFNTDGFVAGSDWKVLNCRFQNNHISGLGISNAGAVVQVEQCQMISNGSTGLQGSPQGNPQDSSFIKNNELAFNNRAGYDPVWHAGGMKITRATNTVVSNNYVHDNIGPGLWIDVYCDLVKVQNNYLRDNIIGIYYELSQNGIITGNYLERHRTNGIYIVNSPNVLVESNTVRYTLNGIVAMQDQRTYNVLCVGENANTANSMCSRQIRNITVRNNFVELNDVNAVAAGVRVLPGSHPNADTVNFPQERFYKNPDYNFVFDKNKYQYTTRESNLKNETAFNWGWGTPSPYDPRFKPKKPEESIRYDSTIGTKVISWTEWQNVAKKDLASCLNSPNATAAQWLEAECGSVGINWQTEDDSQASNGKYLVYLDGNSHLGAPANLADHVVFIVDVTEPGEYSLLARVKAPNSSDDSFWVRINDGEWQTWSGGVLSSSWSWKKIMGKNYNLKPGINTITFAYREDGTQLDKVAVQSSSAGLPSGTGAAASNCTTPPPPAPVVTANAGPDQTVVLGSEPVHLYGFGNKPNIFRLYLWEKVSGPSVRMEGSGANRNLYDLQIGTYEFKFTAINSEGNSDSDEVKVIVIASNARTADRSPKPTVELAPDALTSVLVYPNPVDASLKVSLGTKQPASLSLSDLSGRMLFHQRVVPSSGGQITISTHQFPEGMYLLRIEQQDQVQLTKLLIKH